MNSDMILKESVLFFFFFFQLKWQANSVEILKSCEYIVAASIDLLQKKI